jgi:hypothetical protein
VIKQLKHTISGAIANYKSKQLIKQFYLKNKLNPTNNIVITGSPRSGTTWLAEILTKSEGGFMLFEPLSLTGVKRVNDIGFDWRQHIPEDEIWTEAAAYFEDVYKGKYLTPWMLSHSDKQTLLNTEFFILKFVRANLLLPWLIKTIHPQKMPIFIVRNPISVVSSQMNLGWKSAPKKFDITTAKYAAEFHKPYLEILNKINSTEEYLTAKWCLENGYLLKHEQNNMLWITCVYENFKNNPEKELPKLFKRLELPFNDSILQQIEKPSRSSYKEENNSETTLTPIQKDKCFEIIKQFGLEDFVKETWGL